MMRRTLAEQGFTLPPVPPKVGHARFDATGEWHIFALRKVIAEFLAPELAPIRVSLNAATCQSRSIIDAAAARDGFAARYGMFDEMRYVRGVYKPNGIFFAWLGLPFEAIWPEAARKHEAARHRIEQAHVSPTEFRLSATALQLLREETAAFGGQVALAAATGIPKPTLQKLLAGDAEPSFSRVVAVSRALGLSLDAIAAGQPTPPRSAPVLTDPEPAKQHIGDSSRANPADAYHTAAALARCYCVPPAALRPGALEPRVSRAAPKPRIGDMPPLFRPVYALNRLLTAISPLGALAAATNWLGDWIEQRVEQLDDVSCPSRLQRLGKAAGSWLIAAPDPSPATAVADGPADLDRPGAATASAASQGSFPETPRPDQNRPAAPRPRAGAVASTLAERVSELLSQWEAQPAHSESCPPHAHNRSDSSASPCRDSADASTNRDAQA